MYQAQHYARVPQGMHQQQQQQQQAPAVATRRHPLTNTAINNVNHHQATPPKPPPKAPGSPPLPRQNSKTAPPSPPKIITDKSGRVQFNRVGFLGEGGFARVYEVKDARGARLACKVITKSSLKTKKAKTKLYAEIKIHRSLHHPNIVRFEDCFEDPTNVYMTLELCPSGSLMDLLRRRRRFTEPESRFFMLQLIGACHYMHTHQVIHRDLKLGNLFLDANMNVKVGDFGLAALIEQEGERKKTICGTPNYIAPEVLFDTANGHSFEVDTWSIGVILYTLVIGRPPFQTKDVKAIYKRIRDNEYEFPSTHPISPHAQHLIQAILTPNPAERPTLHEIIDAPWFVQGPVPAYIPTSAHDGPPDWRHISRAQSDVNLRRLRRYALLDGDMAPPSSTNQSSTQASSGLGSATTVVGGVAGSTIAQQEKEFQRAVQPGSPISALLSSARQPLLMTSPSGAAGGPAGAKEGGGTLLRKLQAVTVKESPLGRRSVTRGLDGVVEEKENMGTGAGVTARRRGGDEDGEEAAAETRSRKELEAQKARIVAQMAPVREEGEGEGDDLNDDVDLDGDEYDDAEGQGEDEEDRIMQDRAHRRAPAPPPVPSSVTYKTTVRVVKEKERENVAPAPAPLPTKYAGLKQQQQPTTTTTRPGILVNKNMGNEYTHPTAAIAAPASAPLPPPKLNGFDAAAQTLTAAFEARSAGKIYRDPHFSPQLAQLPDEKVFIVSWVDYCNKYGMGYALTDGSVGVHFNDSTTLVLSPDKVHFDYITSRRQGSVYVRKGYTVETYPEDLKSKVYLLKHFEHYIMERLYGDYEYTFEDQGRERGMEWVQKYLRMKHVIVFKLSHDVLQFNFYDHSKLILSSHGNLITHIDKHHKMTRWSLSEVLATHLQLAANPGHQALRHLDAEAVKFNGRLVDKLKYCKEVLVSIRSASGGAGEGQQAEPELAGMAGVGIVGAGAGAGAKASSVRR